MSRHIGVVAFYYPPSRASGVYRMLAITNHLAEQGWDVTVFTVTPDFFDDVTKSSDQSLLGEIHPSIEVVRVPAPKHHMVTDIRQYGWLRGNFPQLHTRLMKRGLDKVWLDQQGLWVPALVRSMIQAHQQRPLDLVLTTGNPYSSYLAPWLLNKRFGVPYVLDSRDSWTLDLFTDEPAFPDKHPAWKWEKRTFDAAERIYFVNEPLRRWHQDRYPADADRMRVLMNGFDASLLGSPSAAPAPTGGLRYGYVGTLTGAQPHEIVWEGWRSAWQGDDDASDRPTLPADSSMHFYGHIGFFAVSSALYSRLPIETDRTVTWHGAVGKTEIASAYDNLDVLVMLVADSPYVTSGKVFEYMATGKPIVGLYSPDSAVADVLRGYPLVAEASELTVEGVRDAFLRADELARTVTPELRQQALDHAATFERERQLIPFEHELATLVDR